MFWTRENKDKIRVTHRSSGQRSSGKQTEAGDICIVSIHLSNPTLWHERVLLGKEILIEVEIKIDPWKHGESTTLFYIFWQ